MELLTCLLSTLPDDDVANDQLFIMDTLLTMNRAQ
jgi:hypothetical protein